MRPAYATNSAGTAYGDDVSFTTESGSTPTVPSVATYEASDVDQRRRGTLKRYGDGRTAART